MSGIRGGRRCPTGSSQQHHVSFGKTKLNSGLCRSVFSFPRHRSQTKGATQNWQHMKHPTATQKHLALRNAPRSLMQLQPLCFFTLLMAKRSQGQELRKHNSEAKSSLGQSLRQEPWRAYHHTGVWSSSKFPAEDRQVLLQPQLGIPGSAQETRGQRQLCLPGAQRDGEYTNKEIPATMKSIIQPQHLLFTSLHF